MKDDNKRKGDEFFRREKGEKEDEGFEKLAREGRGRMQQIELI